MLHIPQGGLPKSKPTLKFNTEENIREKNLTQRMGINSKKEWFGYVCIKEVLIF